MKELANAAQHDAQDHQSALNAFAKSTSSASDAQTAGRRNAELDTGLNSMQALVDATTEEQEAHAKENAKSRSQELSAISAGTVAAAKAQEEGRRHKELNSGLASMQALVEKTAADQGASVSNNAASRISELKNISAGTRKAAKTQEEGRRNKELDQGLASMQALVTSTKENLQTQAEANTAQRNQELTTVSKGTVAAAQAQEEGRRHKELNSGLASMQALVEKTAADQGASVSNNAASRISELKNISAGTIAASEAQTAGRRNAELDTGLNSMQALVDETASAAANDFSGQQDDLSAALCELEGGNASLVTQ